MPTISIFFGILIKMFHQEHNPPHFHAYYQGFEAIFNIETGDKTHGKFPKKAEKIVSEWAKEHKQELIEDWILAEKNMPMNKIPGADQ